MHSFSIIEKCKAFLSSLYSLLSIRHFAVFAANFHFYGMFQGSEEDLMLYYVFQSHATFKELNIYSSDLLYALSFR